jgi:RHS repeat-associated protein
LSNIWRPLLATDSSGKQTFYIWEGKTPLAAISAKEVKFFLHDHLGSVRFIANEEGKIVHRQNYGPFGVPHQGSVNAALLPGFSGLFLDPVAKQYLTRAYNPVLGRFMQLDPQHRTPFGSQKDLSMYNYCGNDPINFIDLNGADRQRSQYLTSHPEYGIEALKKFGEEFFGPGPLAGMPPCLVPTPWGGTIDLVDTLGKALAMANLYLAANAYIFNTSGAFAHWIPGIMHMSSSIVSAIKPYAAGGALTTGLTPTSIPTPPPPLTSIATATPTTTPVPTKPTPTATAIAMPTSTPRHMVPTLTPTPTPTPTPTVTLASGATPTVSPTPTQYAGRLAPSNVGGIYLKGAGDALKDLGSLKGIAIDENNGRLVLLSQEKGEIDLSPLRMDDVVTIFRSVYEHGDAPYVSIDPDPRDPQGPKMLVRHGKGTEGTYVGWVLFEADRVMKAYSLGYDNVTREKLESQVEGYQNIIDLGFSGFSGHQKKPIWERFWIVPAEVNRSQTGDKRLTLLDVPLKVNTQKMELRKGKLVPAADDTPSKAAQEFSKWFTKHYDDLSKEAFSKPPEDSGIDLPVPFFGELRRIALVTSIAETLRDQGIPFPLWMKHYSVKPCTITPTTPTITVTASKTKRTKKGESIQQQSVTGGVSLSASDKEIHTQKGAPEAEELAPEVLEKIAAVPVLSPVAFKKDGKRYQAVALPGNDTRDVGANSLNQVDLDVPVQRGTRIALERRFHSFFKPSGVLGSGWTLDLPRLEKWRRPKKRTGDKVTYKTVYQLTSPLNTWNESFSEHKFVKEVNAKILAPAVPGKILGMVNSKDHRIGTPTDVLIFRDGRQWHFDDNGNLVARGEAPLMVIYRRDAAHRIRRIEGWYGDKLRADIRLEYDAKGRVISATGSNESVVQYKYDKESLLTRAENSMGVLAYDYKNGLVTSVSRNGKVESHFEYTPRGQLKREQRADGTQIAYAVNRGQDGVEISALLTQSQGKETSTQYDVKFRPVRRVLEDGTYLQWRHLDSGATETTINTPEGDQYHVTHSADHNKTRIQFPEGGTYQVEHDSAGRMASLKKGNLQVLRQQWHQDGQLAKQQYESVALIPEYRKDRVLTGLLVTPPGDAREYSQWLHIDYDELGRPIKQTDYSGAETKTGYDDEGNLGIMVSKRGGIKITRNSIGKVDKVETSWGYGQHNSYDPNSGDLKKVEVTSGNTKSVIEFDNGKPTRVKHVSYSKSRVSRQNLSTGIPLATILSM